MRNLLQKLVPMVFPNRHSDGRRQSSASGKQVAFHVDGGAIDHDFPFDLNESLRDLKKGRIVHDYDPRKTLAMYRASKARKTGKTASPRRWSGWAVAGALVTGMIAVKVGLTAHLADRADSILTDPIQIIPVAALVTVAVMRLFQEPSLPVTDDEPVNERRARSAVQIATTPDPETDDRTPLDRFETRIRRADTKFPYEISFLDVARLAIRAFALTGDLGPARHAAKIMNDGGNPLAWSQALIDLEHRLPALSHSGGGRCRRRSEVVSAYVDGLRIGLTDGLGTNRRFLPKSEFLWIKKKDRSLWYALLNAERTMSYFPEGLGIHPRMVSDVRHMLPPEMSGSALPEGSGRLRGDGLT